MRLCLHRLQDFFLPFIRTCGMAGCHLSTPTPFLIFIIVILWLVLRAFAFYNFGTSYYLCEAREWRDAICRFCLSVFIIIIILLRLRPMHMLCPLCPSHHRSFFHTKLRHGTKHDCRNRLQCFSSSPTFAIVRPCRSHHWGFLSYKAA